MLSTHPDQLAAHPNNLSPPAAAATKVVAEHPDPTIGGELERKALAGVDC